MSYHITPKTGQENPCNPEVTGICKYAEDGVNPPHYETREEARAAYEEANRGNMFAKIVSRAKRVRESIPSSGKLRKTMFKVGATSGVALAAFTLTGCGTIEDPFEGAEAKPAAPQTPIDHIEAAPERVTDAVESGVEKLQEEETQEKIKSGVGTLSEFGKDAWGKLTAEAQKYLDGSSDSYSNGSIEINTDGMYWQGRSITPSAEEVSEARDILAGLTVTEKYDDGNYNRAEMYGRSFQTGVAGRTERRDITDGVFKNETPQARAIGGSFIDPYSGQRIEVSTSNNHDTNIEHVVALKDAYKSETRELSKDERVQLANDPMNLQIVSASENQSKGDKSADNWAVPNNPQAAPIYVISQIKVKDKYDLSVSPAEKVAMENILNSVG